jgi:glycosyltransferase involved in cell wall biosynthesis
MLVTGADPRRFEFTVACLADGPFVDELVAAGVRVVRLRAQRLRYPWAYLRTIARLRTLATSHDLVFAWQVKANYYARPAALLARTPAVWYDHGIRPRRGEPRFLVDALLPSLFHTRVVIASSRASAERHRGGRAILSSIDLSPYETLDRGRARASLGAGENDRIIGIVGRLQPWKGQDVFLRACAEVARTHADARFVVIGGTPGGFSAEFPARLQTLARELGIDEATRFLGHRDDVPALLPGLDVFVNASYAEPFGLVTIEAMAAGVPIVATDSGGTLEIITHGETGTLVTTGDPAAMAAAISAYLDDPGRAGRIAGTARRHAFGYFGAQRFLREAQDLIEELVPR